MNRKLFMMAMTALLVGAIAPVQAEEKTAGINWVDTIEKAKPRALKEKKIIMVDFYADWCGPCKEMLKTTYKDKAVIDKTAKFVPVLLNVDKQPATAKKYNVEAIPTVIFMDATGKVLKSSTGYHDAKEFLKMIAEVEAKAKK